MTSEWIDVGDSESVNETAPLSAEVDGIPIVVVRCGADIYAVEDRCTHDGEPLGEAEVEACQIVCPRHGAHFCLRTGEALTPPAYEPLRTFKVREERGRVLVEAPT
jgi:3-phenylpropionate/trans-cinnamate dioxygenase ferredoxin component